MRRLTNTVLINIKGKDKQCCILWFHFPPHCLKTLRRFFEDYKVLENKEVIIEKFLGPEEARQVINDAFALYEENKTHLPGDEGE